MNKLTTALTVVGLVLLLSLRFVGLYSHQAFAVVLIFGTPVGNPEPNLAEEEQQEEEQQEEEEEVVEKWDELDDHEFAAGVLGAQVVKQMMERVDEWAKLMENEALKRSGSYGFEQESVADATGIDLGWDGYAGWRPHTAETVAATTTLAEWIGESAPFDREALERAKDLPNNVGWFVIDGEAVLAFNIETPPGPVLDFVQMLAKLPFERL